MTAILSVPAILNGYPFLFDDSGTYIRAAIDRAVPEDRPIYYSVFLLLLHWKALWPAVIAQCGAVAALIWLLGFRLFRVTSVAFYAGLAAGLAVASTLPWFAGQIMPDIFAGVLFLALILLVFCWERQSWPERIFCLACVAASVAFHNANLLLALCAAPVFFIVRLLGWRSESRLIVRAGAIAVAIGVSAAALVGANVYAFHKVTLSPSASTFLLARFIEDGPGIETLKANCPASGWRVCGHLQELVDFRPPADNPEDSVADEFLWSLVGPLGGFRAMEPESATINAEVIRHYPLEVLSHAVMSAISLAPKVNVGAKTAFHAIAPEDYVATTITRVYGPEDAARMLASAQARGALPLPAVNVVSDVVLIGSLGFLLVALVRSRGRDNAVYYAIIAMLLCLAANLFVMGALSGPYERYEARVVWLIPLFAALTAARWRGIAPRPS